MLLVDCLSNKFEVKYESAAIYRSDGQVLTQTTSSRPLQRLSSPILDGMGDSLVGMPHKNVIDRDNYRCISAVKK